MNTARIVVLAIAAGAGLTAPCLASAIDSPPPPVAQPAAHQAGTLSPTPHSSADARAVKSSSTDRTNLQSGSVDVIRHVIAIPTTVQK